MLLLDTGLFSTASRTETGWNRVYQTGRRFFRPCRSRLMALCTLVHAPAVSQAAGALAGSRSRSSSGEIDRHKDDPKGARTGSLTYRHTEQSQLTLRKLIFSIAPSFILTIASIYSSPPELIMLWNASEP
jgi:hypothetical protein